MADHPSFEGTSPTPALLGAHPTQATPFADRLLTPKFRQGVLDLAEFGQQNRPAHLDWRGRVQCDIVHGKSPWMVVVGRNHDVKAAHLEGSVPDGVVNNQIIEMIHKARFNEPSAIAVSTAVHGRDSFFFATNCITFP